MTTKVVLSILVNMVALAASGVAAYTAFGAAKVNGESVLHLGMLIAGGFLGFTMGLVSARLLSASDI